MDFKFFQETNKVILIDKRYYILYRSNTMIGYSTITQKGQVTIPASIRAFLGLRPRQRVVITKDATGVVIRPESDFFSLYGSIKTKKKLNIAAIRKSAKKLLARRYQHG